MSATDKVDVAIDSFEIEGLSAATDEHVRAENVQVGNQSLVALLREQFNSQYDLRWKVLEPVANQ